jgi:hypothetical protein
MTTERSDGLKQSSSFADNDWIDDDAVFVDETCLREPRDDAAASDRRSRSPPLAFRNGAFRISSDTPEA